MRIPLTLLRRPPRPAVERDPRENAFGATSPERPGVLERAAKVDVDEPTRSLYQAISLLLDYPDPALVARLPLLRRVVADCAAAGVRSAERLVPLLDWLAATELTAAQSTYVDTFDQRRRCCLHLTYYGHGDTRRRGMALLDIKQAYLACGVDLAETELPDHVCVLLEFTAAHAPGVGRVLLGDHRPGIELLRLSLTDRGSVYVGALEALTGTFPTLVGDDRDAVAALIAAGPPDEEVGMEAYSSGSRPHPNESRP